MTAVPIALAILVGCSSSSIQSPVTSASADPTALSIPLTGAPLDGHLATPTTVGAADWGPMAVTPPPPITHEAALQGVLRITEDCVYLQARGGSTLVIWPSNLSAWRPSLSAVEFINPAGPVLVAAGDNLVLGGSGMANTGGEDWVGKFEWVAEPNPSCPLKAYWQVAEVITL